MQDNGFIPPMMPDDFAALAALAGPLYKESKTLEAFTSSNPIPNAFDNYGSMNIKQSLEQAQRLTQATLAQGPRPQYVPPAESQFIADVPYVPTPTYIPTPITTAVPQPDNGQLEFKFDAKEQNITNDLLKEISKKMSKIIDLLEREDINEVKKLIPQKK
jgi:hypothetical protein